ncbi:hypothetical protein G6011_03717 [Alternaria panax]|uniref:F-box domain-containing protein n=1 Tax=Alternaria panax TaxID=48097 RepID=A0AAD4IFN1_9PLEO|nr:hypothetical protein G6011_03717 [Alternaria panax]
MSQRSNMYSHRPTDCASQTPLEIPELTENILNHLPHIHDLLHIRETSKFLKAMVDTTPSIQRRLWKAPNPVRYGENSHLAEPTEARSESRVDPSKRHVLESFGLAEWGFFDALEAGEDITTAVTTRNQKWHQLWAQMDPTMRTPHDIIQNPPSYVCRNCYHAHDPFNPSVLHHALSFLRSHEMCGRGFGSELLLHFSLGKNTDADPILKPELNESMEMGSHRSALFRIASLARAVNDALGIAKQYSLLQDYFTSPMCTRFVMTQNMSSARPGSGMDIVCCTVRIEQGLRLGHVLAVLLEMCQHAYQHRVTEVFGSKHLETLQLYEETQRKFSMLVTSPSMLADIV